MQKYRVNEACQVTGLSRKTIYRKMEKGLLFYSIENGKRYICSEDLAPFVKSEQVEKVGKNYAYCECVGLRNEVTALRRKIEKLTTAIESMTRKSVTTTIQKSDTETSHATKALSGDNAKRSEEAKLRLFAALKTMDDIPMYRGKPSITGIHRATGIDRGTISKYLDEYMSSK